MKKKYSEQYQIYYALITDKIFLKIGNRTDAEDLAQDIFIQLYQKFDKIQNVRKWLYGAIRIELMNHYKNKIPTEEINILLNDASFSFVNGFRDTRIIINNIINNENLFKNKKEHTIFELIAIKGFTYNQAGEKFGMSKHKVKYLYADLRNRILDALKKQGIKTIEELL